MPFNEMQIIKSIGSKKNFGVSGTKNFDYNSIARVSDNDKTIGYITMSKNSNKKDLKIDDENHIIEPLLNLGEERQAIIISGESGSGKSLLASMLIKQYKKSYQENQVYLISEKPKNIDRNFQNIDFMHQFTKEEIENFELLNYTNSLFVIDDCDYSTDIKKIYNILNNIAILGREMGISFAFVTHINSNLSAGAIYKEFRVYYTYSDNLINNRMLFQNMGFSNKEIDYFISLESSFYCFSRIYNTLLYDGGAMKYRNLDEKINKSSKRSKKQEE